MTTQTYLIQITPAQHAQTARTIAALCDLAQRSTDIEEIGAIMLAARFAVAVHEARPIRVIDDHQLDAIHRAQHAPAGIADHCLECGGPLDDCPHMTCDACAAGRA
jgi:hypothetical protein